MKSDRKAVVFGGGGHARALVDVLGRMDVQIRAVVAPEAEGLDAPLVTDDKDGRDLIERERCWAIIGIGDNRQRLKLLDTLAMRDVDLSPLVASSATVAVDAALEAGAVVLEHAHIGPRARVGGGSITNTGAIVEHDTVLGRGCHVAVGSTLAGTVAVGEGTLIGTGASVLPGVTVGSWAVVAAGAVVADDVAATVTVAGVPARRTPRLG